MRNALDEKFSLDDLLDGINNEPDSIDTRIIGSVTAGVKRVTQKTVKGLPLFSEVNIFIDKFGRVPKTTALDFHEKCLAYRLQGYAKNPEEYQALIPYDDHSLIGNKSLITEVEIPDVFDLFADTSTDIFTDTQPPVIDSSHLIEPDVALDILTAKNPVILPAPTDADAEYEVELTGDTESNVDSDAELAAKSDYQHEYNYEDLVSPASDAIVNPDVIMIDDVVVPVADITVADDADDERLCADPLGFNNEDWVDNTADLDDDYCNGDYDPNAFDKPVVEVVTIDEAFAAQVNDDLAVEVLPPALYAMSPPCSVVIAPVLDILYQQAISFINTPKPALANFKPDDNSYYYSDDQLAAGADASVEAHYDLVRTANTTSQNNIIADAVLPTTNKPAGKSNPEVYIAIHIDESRYQDYINPKSAHESKEETELMTDNKQPVSPASSAGSTCPKTTQKPSKTAKSGSSPVDIVTKPKSKNIDFELKSTENLDEIAKTNQQKPTNDASIDDILDLDADFIADLAATDNEWFASGLQSASLSSAKPIAKPDEVGKQTKCHDFYMYEGKLKSLHEGLTTGRLKTITHTAVNFKEGDAFIMGGMLGFIQSVGDMRIGSKGNDDPRLRLIFDNGTESNILLSTLNKNLYMDDTGRRIINNAEDFADFDTPSDEVKVRTGQLYIVRSLSTNPKIRDTANLYKIGFTTKTIEDRAYNSRNDTAFLESTVEVVLTAECYNLNPRGLESIVHDFLYAQRLLVTLTSKDGQTYHPKEWFCVDINDAKRIIQLIIDGQLTNYRMNNTTGRLVSK